MTIKLIGDIHGHFNKYLELTEDAEYSIQLGDLGFNYYPLNFVDHKRHKFIGGNHDNYDSLPKHSLGDFGMSSLNEIQFFFIRGGYSIDCGDRRIIQSRGNPKEWWHQEELSYVEMRSCEEVWRYHKPEILLTHTPPNSIIKKVSNNKIMSDYGYTQGFKCKTSEFIDYLLQIHKPKFICSGHMHCSFEYEEQQTIYKILNINETCDLGDYI